MCREVGKVSYTHLKIVDHGSNFRQFLMRAPQEVVKKSKFIHQFERRGMNSIPAKIAKKIRVLFEHEHFDARTSEKKTQHHTSRSSTHDAATGSHYLRRGINRIHGRWPSQYRRVSYSIARRMQHSGGAGF